MRLKVNKLIADRIFQNILLLSSSQALNLLLPLVTYPYLIWKLGLETYGLIVFIQTFVAYFGIIVSYGLNIYFIREVSISRDDHTKLSYKFSLFILIRILLMLFSLILMSIIVFLTETLWSNIWLIIFCTYLIFNQGLLPTWYFQGIEKLKTYTAVYTLGRILYLILILLFIKNETDFLLVPIMNMIASIVTINLLFIYITSKHKIKWINPGISKVVLTLKSSFPFLISNLSTYAYINSNKFILGATLGMTEVGIYDLADKIVSLAKQPQYIIAQVVFPKISRYKKLDDILKFAKISFAVSFIIILLIFFGSSTVVSLFVEDNITEIIYILKILSITIPLVTISGVIVNNLFIVFNDLRSYVITVLSGLVFYSFGTFVLIKSSSFSLQSAAWNNVLVETIVVLVALIYVKRNRNYV
jgi:O-antigen/teichoic acid export membrane protein